MSRYLYIDGLGREHARPASVPARWRIAGYAAIERDGRVLLVEPVSGIGPAWHLPGGGIHLEAEETIIEGIVREVHEETGYRFEPEPGTLAFLDDVFMRTLEGEFLRSVSFTVRGDAGEGPDADWSPDSDIVRVAWIEPTTLRPGHVHRLHWRALVRLGVVTEGP